MTESEFDALLRRALIDVIHEDYADILEGEPDVPPHTEKYLRRKRKLLADPIGYVRRLARPVWKKTLRMVACILLALATLFGSVMALSPSARAWVMRMYTEWKEQSAVFFFFSDQSGVPVPSNWRPSYIPEGFDSEEAVDTASVTRIVYSNKSTNDNIYFRYCPLYNNSSLNIDNEHMIIEEVSLHSGMATLFLSDDASYQSHLTWMNEEEDIAFSISGFIDSQELIKMADSVKKVI